MTFFYFKVNALETGCAVPACYRLKLEEEQQRLREHEARERELERERERQAETERARELERRSEERSREQSSVVIRDQRGDYIRASATRYSPAKHVSFPPQDAFYTDRNRVHSVGIFIPQDPLAKQGEPDRHRQVVDYRQAHDVKHRTHTLPAHLVRV